MHLEGSCHCGSVRFSVESAEYLPFMRCYCSICRKTAGTGGYAINRGADHATLKVKGKRHLRVYQARIDDKGGEVRLSSGQRHFCGKCGTALWLWDPQWPELVHPHAGAIDTPLPAPPADVHILLDSKAPWVQVEGRAGDECFAAYPPYSLREWHEAHGKQAAGAGAEPSSRRAFTGRGRGAAGSSPSKGKHETTEATMPRPSEMRSGSERLHHGP